MILEGSDCPGSVRPPKWLEGGLFFEAGKGELVGARDQRAGGPLQLPGMLRHPFAGDRGRPCIAEIGRQTESADELLQIALITRRVFRRLLGGSDRQVLRPLSFVENALNIDGGERPVLFTPFVELLACDDVSDDQGCLFRLILA